MSRLKMSLIQDHSVENHLICCLPFLFNCRQITQFQYCSRVWISDIIYNKAWEFFLVSTQLGYFYRLRPFLCNFYFHLIFTKNSFVLNNLLIIPSFELVRSFYLAELKLSTSHVRSGSGVGFLQLWQSLISYAQFIYLNFIWKEGESLLADLLFHF